MTAKLATALALLVPAAPALSLAEDGFGGLDDGSRFPYEAAVMTEGVPVRSGPGRQFYETDRLARGTHVVVVRHDPGGWAMVVPPAGSHSLVPQTAVTNAGDGLLRIVEEDVSVRVGSNLTAEYDVEQIHLRPGDRLRPAGPTANVPEGWLAVSPPRGEYRWIPRQFVLADDPALRRSHDADPFAIPSTTQRPATFEEGEIQTAGLWTEPTPPETDDDGPAFASEAPTLVAQAPTPTAPVEVAEADAAPAFVLDRPATPLLSVAKPAAVDPSDSLARVDAFLDGLDAVEPTAWDLEAPAAALDAIAAEVGANWSAPLDLRRRRIERLAEVRGEYRDYLALTTATDGRETALRERQTALETGSTTTAAAPTGSQAAASAPGPIQTASAESPAAPALLPPATSPFAQLPQNDIVQTAATSPAADAGSSFEPVAPRRFAAVGVIRRIDQPKAGMPPHVLIDAAGNVAAVLRPAPGIALDRFLGTPFGVDGPVTNGPNLAVPVLTVTSLTPVALPAP